MEPSDDPAVRARAAELEQRRDGAMPPGPGRPRPTWEPDAGRAETPFWMQWIGVVALVAVVLLVLGLVLL